MKEWYVIHVRTGKEEAVRSWLLKNGSFSEREVLVPKTLKYEWRKGKRTLAQTILFKGYVLVQIDLRDEGYEDYYLIKKNPYVYRLLDNGEDIQSVNGREIEILFKLMDNRSTIGLTKAYCAGGKINFTEGPLYGMEYLVKKVNKRKERAYIGINISDRLSMIAVGLDIEK